MFNTVDGRNPANQLRLVVYPIIYRVLYIPGGDRRISEPSTVCISLWLKIQKKTRTTTWLWYLFEDHAYGYDLQKDTKFTKSFGQLLLMAEILHQLIGSFSHYL